MERRDHRYPEEEMVESFRLDNSSSRIDPDLYLSWEGSLMHLIDWTRTRIGQEKLADGKAVPVFLSLLKRVHLSCLVGRSSDSSPPPPATFTRILLQFLKLLRNLCVADLNKETFHAEKGVVVLADISTALLSVCKASHDLNQREDSLEAKFSTKLNSSADGSATCFQEDAYTYSKMKADLEAIGRSSCADLSVSTSGIALYAGNISASASVECLRMLLQLLGNFSRGGDTCQVAVWQEFFPTIFSELASLPSSTISDVLCMILCTCCQGSKERSWQLCQGQGVGLVSRLIASAVTNEEIRDEQRIDWFEALWQHLCLEEDLFPLLFTNLGIIPVRQVLDFSKVHTEEYFCACQIWLRTCTFTFVQVSLLSLLIESLNDYLVPASYSTDEEKSGLKIFISKDSLCFLVKILERAADCVREELGMDSVNPLSTWTFAPSPSVRVLGSSLLLWRVLGTCDPKMKQRELLTQVLLQRGLLDLLLIMLEALGTPKAPGRRPNVENQVKRNFSGPVRVPFSDSYEGYRRDIVAAIANVAHQNMLVQEHVRKKGKLLLVLQQCTPDQYNPFLREWGLWAMRNLLEGNDMNQKEVASLEMKEAVSLPELTNMGLRFELDPNTGGPRLVNIGS